VDFTGDDNSMKLKARVNPNVLLAVAERYGEHGKITNLRFDGEVMTPRGGGGYYAGLAGGRCGGDWIVVGVVQPLAHS